MIIARNKPTFAVHPQQHLEDHAYLCFEEKEPFTVIRNMYNSKMELEPVLLDVYGATTEPLAHREQPEYYGLHKYDSDPSTLHLYVQENKTEQQVLAFFKIAAGGKRLASLPEHRKGIRFIRVFVACDLELTKDWTEISQKGYVYTVWKIKTV